MRSSFEVASSVPSLLKPPLLSESLRCIGTDREANTMIVGTEVSLLHSVTRNLLTDRGTSGQTLRVAYMCAS